MTIEDGTSWELYQERLLQRRTSSLQVQANEDSSEIQSIISKEDWLNLQHDLNNHQRNLKKHHKKDDNDGIETDDIGSDDDSSDDKSEKKKSKKEKKKEKKLKKEKKKEEEKVKWGKRSESYYDIDDCVYAKDKHTQHGMMIDAGSQGTRMHVYEFKSRILYTKHDIEQVISGLKLSFPTTDTRWTNRLKPGLDTFAFVENENERIDEVRQYLEPLLNFSKEVLIDKHYNWTTYPIYLKATGGLRALPRTYRIRLIQTVRTIMHDMSFNPFFFQDEHMRVISGEEEAIYGWTAVNFAQGQLIKQSEGTGTVDEEVTNKTYGVLEMGGASAQIGFYEPNGDVMANLFKLQIGAAKHWNVYVHSFLYFGVNLAYDVLNAGLYIAATTNTSSVETKSPGEEEEVNGIYNPCLPGGSQYLFSSRVHAFPNGTLLPLSSAKNASSIEAHLYSAIMRNDNAKGDYDQCYVAVQKLLRKDANAWCDFAHDRDCSFAGIYQPPLPVMGNELYSNEFIATSNFFDVYDFLGIAGIKVSMERLRTRSKYVCNMSVGELIVYNNQRKKPYSSMDELASMCFRSVFVSSFLIEGVGFPLSSEITAFDVLNGQKVDWALGSMLYEINTLPWEFEKDSVKPLVSQLEKEGLIRTLPTANGDNTVDRMYMYDLLLIVAIAVGIVNIIITLKNRKAPDRHHSEHAEESSSLINCNKPKKIRVI